MRITLIEPAGLAAIIVAFIAAVVSISTEIARRRDKAAAIKEGRPKSVAEIRAINAETYNKQLVTIGKLRDELEEEIGRRRADRDRLIARMKEMEARHAEEIGNLTDRICISEAENHKLLRENHELRAERKF